MQKKLLFFTAALLLVLCCSACSQPRCSKEAAARILERNGERLAALAQRIMETGTVPEEPAIPGVERVSYLPPGWVEFCTATRGPLPGSSYCGFYYSPGNDPLGYQGTKMELATKGPGWTWEEPGGDNRYYTEALQDQWFYYSISF